MLSWFILRLSLVPTRAPAAPFYYWHWNCVLPHQPHKWYDSLWRYEIREGKENCFSSGRSVSLVSHNSYHVITNKWPHAAHRSTGRVSCYSKTTKNTFFTGQLLHFLLHPVLGQILISSRVAECSRPLEELCKSFKVRAYKSPQVLSCQCHYGKKVEEWEARGDSHKCSADTVVVKFGD